MAGHSKTKNKPGGKRKRHHNGEGGGERDEDLNPFCGGTGRFGENGMLFLERSLQRQKGGWGDGECVSL